MSGDKYSALSRVARLLDQLKAIKTAAPSRVALVGELAGLQAAIEDEREEPTCEQCDARLRCDNPCCDKDY